MMWQQSRLVLVWTIGLFANTSVLEAADVAALAKQIDQRIHQRHVQEGITPRPLVSDHQFIRRVTLDLAGRVPTIAELDAFVESTDHGKRAKLIQRLIDSPDFAFHQRNEMDILLLRRLEHNDSWREYLLEATKANRSWEQMFREIMLPEDHCPDDPRPVAFLKKRINNIDSLTND
ncbi:MAG: DUF1549 domain-containing protein, partial [Pirellulales bacterium]|nr:DUF1549 domain-containing protein [Pirellulales bacterium]